MADDDFLINTLSSGQQGVSSHGIQGQGSQYTDFNLSPLGPRDGATSYGGTPNRSSRTPGKPPRKSILDSSGRRYVEIKLRRFFSTLQNSRTI